MKIMSRELAAAVSACASVADRGNIPIMKTIRIMASKGMAEFTASDTAQTIQIRAACDGDLSVCIDATALDQKARALKSGEVDIIPDEKSVTIVQGRTKWKIPVLPVVDFPSFGDAIKGKKITLPDAFLADLKAVLPHVDQERAMLMGVHFDGKHIVATDGKRLAVIEASDKLPKVTVPTQAINRLALLGGGEITAQIGELAATFSTEFVTLRTQLVAEAYPDWNRIIPDLPNETIVDRAEFLATVQRATAIRADDKRIVYVKLTFGDEIQVFSRNAADEEGSDYVASSGGAEGYVGLNAEKLREVVGTLECESIRIRYQDFQTPILIEPVTGDRQNIRVVMPVRLPAGFAA